MNTDSSDSSFVVLKSNEDLYCVVCVTMLHGGATPPLSSWCGAEVQVN
jgi:hypothetical protein